MCLSAQIKFAMRNKKKVHMIWSQKRGLEGLLNNNYRGYNPFNLQDLMLVVDDVASLHRTNDRDEAKRPSACKLP